MKTVIVTGNRKINSYMSAAALVSMLVSRGEGESESFTKEQLDEAVSNALAEATKSSDGLTKKNKELLSEMKTMKDQIKQFEGIDPEKTKQMFAAFEENEDMKLISEGKYQEVIDKKLEKERATWESKQKSFDEEKTALSTKNEALTAKVTKLMIDNNVVNEFVNQEGEKTAIDDVKLRALQVFKVETDESGVDSVVARDADGHIITGKDGAMTIGEWVVDLKEKAPHLFQGSKGSNTPGGGPGGGPGSIQAKIDAASKSGDAKEYQRLRKIQKEQRNKQE